MWLRSNKTLLRNWAKPSLLFKVNRVRTLQCTPDEVNMQGALNLLTYFRAAMPELERN